MNIERIAFEALSCHLTKSLKNIVSKAENMCDTLSCFHNSKIKTEYISNKNNVYVEIHKMIITSNTF